MLLDSLFLLMEKLKFYIIIILLLTVQACEKDKPVIQSENNTQLVLGDDRLLDEFKGMIEGKNLGVVANRASVLSNGVLLTDTLRKIKGVTLKLIFTPEHGFSITSPAGQNVHDSTEGSVPVYSLYGKHKKPTGESLKEIDLIVFDLQDIGSRFYTYISTLYYVMQSAAENRIPVVVLDRPNPIGGVNVEGPVLKPDLQSFIGVTKIPVIHGMTTGEIAKLFAGEFIKNFDPALLTIIKMKNWNRDSYFGDYKLKWINPSPNIPDAETEIIYPATAFLEGTNVSEGRGTDAPFKQIGAPFINPLELKRELDNLQHPGISVQPVSFIPVSISGRSLKPQYENEKCRGISIRLDNPRTFRQVEFSIKLLYALHKFYPEKFKFKSEYFDKLAGNRSVRMMLLEGRKPEQIIESWQSELKRFLDIRKKYLLY